MGKMSSYTKERVDLAADVYFFLFLFISGLGSLLFPLDLRCDWFSDVPERLTCDKNNFILPGPRLFHGLCPRSRYTRNELIESLETRFVPTQTEHGLMILAMSLAHVVACRIDHERLPASEVANKSQIKLSKLSDSLFQSPVPLPQRPRQGSHNVSVSPVQGRRQVKPANPPISTRV